jgi:pyruvate formate lyase activating enzyme
MDFYGLQKVTLLDYPNEVAATLFTFGCNMCCSFCHNPELVIDQYKNSPKKYSLDETISFLKKRKEKLTGVCISGGEPLIHNEIVDVIREIKNLGFKVKVDTNGSNPSLLKKIDVDYVAMDIKTSLDRYKLVDFAGSGDIKELIKESIDFLINSDMNYEFRTTAFPEIFSVDDLKEILKIIKGAKRYNIIQFRHIKKLLSKSAKSISPYSDEIINSMRQMVLDNGIETNL